MTTRRSFKLADIAAKFGGELIGDGEVRVARVASLESAQAADIAFLSRRRYLAQLNQTRAAAVILGPESRDACELPRIVSDNPYAYFAKVSELLNPTPRPKPGRHRSAVVDRTARIASSASIGARAVIGKRVRILDHAVVGAGCVIGDDVLIGTSTRLHANVTVYHECSLGERCILHSGVVIGADGFGIAQEQGVWKKIPQIGRVIIGNDVEIGANTTVDRGALDDTVIEEGVKLDNLIQVAHNVKIGAHTAVAGCVGIAGSAHIGRHCAIGGAARIHGHITIPDNTTISACTLIMKSLPVAGTYTGAFPASPHESWLRNAAHLRRLDELATRVRELERRLKERKEDES